MCMAFAAMKLIRLPCDSDDAVLWDQMLLLGAAEGSAHLKV